MIANSGGTNGCQGQWIKASVAPDGKSYDVQIGPEGQVRTYQTRQHTALQQNSNEFSLHEVSDFER